MNWFRSTTLKAAADMRTLQYHAVALDDENIANNGEEAIGILQSKPNTSDHMTVGYVGEMKYRAGAAVTQGDPLTVTTSGWFTTADSNDFVVGQAKADITSGSIGTGLFSFPTGVKTASAFSYTVTAADAITAGKAYALNDNKLAATGLEASGVAVSAIASGDSGQIVLMGVVGAATLSDSYGPDQDLMVVGSGYFSATTSGFVPNARVLVGTTSGENATVLFWGGGGQISA